MEIFGKRLKELRYEENLSAKKLGERIGISDASIIRWENNINDPTIDYLIGFKD